MSEAGRQHGNQPHVGVGQQDGERPPLGGKAASQPWYRRLLPIVALSAAWAVTMVALLAWGLVARANDAPGTTSCKKPQPVPGVPSSPPGKPAQLKPRAEPVTAVPFSRSRTAQRRMVEYDVTDPGKVLVNVSQLDVFRGQFLSGDGSHQLNPDDINATATVRNGRVLLAVCFDRTGPDFGAPASYLGTISIVDPRVTRTDVTFNVTMSYPWWQLAAAVFVAMLLPALLYVWFLRGSFQSHQGLTLDLLQKWLFSRTALMALGAGFAAAISVFSAIYAKAPTWGGDWTSATALFGATFSAFVAAATAVTAAGSDRSSPNVTNGELEVSEASGQRAGSGARSSDANWS